MNDRDYTYTEEDIFSVLKKEVILTFDFRHAADYARVSTANQRLIHQELIPFRYNSIGHIYHDWANLKSSSFGRPAPKRKSKKDKKGEAKPKRTDKIVRAKRHDQTPLDILHGVFKALGVDPEREIPFIAKEGDGPQNQWKSLKDILIAMKGVDLQTKIKWLRKLAPIGVHDYYDIRKHRRSDFERYLQEDFKDFERGLEAQGLSLSTVGNECPKFWKQMKTERDERIRRYLRAEARAAEGLEDELPEEPPTPTVHKMSQRDHLLAIQHHVRALLQTGASV